MRAKDDNINGSTWFHQDKPNKDLTVMTLVTGLVAFIVVLFSRTNAEAVIGILLLVTLITLAVFLTQTITTNIEIDRRSGVVIRTIKYPLLTMRKCYPLQEYDSIKLLAKDEPAEDGYRILRYSVVLAGRRRSLELLSAGSKAEGKRIQKELSVFLGLPA